MIPSGNTLVMGGLINDTKTKNYTKVPLLGDLPGIGLAFRHENKTRNKQNLLIFITPTIVEDDALHVTSSAAEFLNNRIRPFSVARSNIVFPSTTDILRRRASGIAGSRCATTISCSDR